MSSRPGSNPASTPTRIPASELPACLSDLSAPPAGLWCLGDRTLLHECSHNAVAIVGTRDTSEYGERTAARLAAAAARQGVVVVSGMARGVDAAAHRAAMEAGGRTIAVLGTGVDVPYPASHRALHRLVQDSGAVLSEMEPGRTAFPGCFPRRNRLVVGLAKLLVVVEAGFKSGAMNSANWAQELGRDLAAVPGHLDDPRAAGSNGLIRDGALVISDVEDLLMILGLSTSASHSIRQTATPGEGSIDRLPPGDRAILLTLGARPITAPEIAFATSMSVRQVGEGLLRLELSGWVESTPRGYLLRPDRNSNRIPADVSR